MHDSERNKYIIFIDENINELKFDFRKEVLQILLYAFIDDDEKIIEKGSGTQIKYDNIDSVLLKNIYNFIRNKIEMTTEFI